MSTSEQAKTRTITLTDAPPVKIREDEWPVIAHGQYTDHDGEVEYQANRKWRADIRVRRHADCRMIVYGVYDYDTEFQRERAITTRAGELLEPGADPVAAIRAVGATLAESTEEAGYAGFRSHISAAVRDCIADLPAVEL